MWASIDTDNNVTKVYTRPTAITYGDVNYPSNVMSSWSNSELATIGVYPAITDNSNYEDPAYYINTNETFTYYDSVSVGGTTYTKTVVGAYGTAGSKVRLRGPAQVTSVGSGGADTLNLQSFAPINDIVGVTDIDSATGFTISLGKIDSSGNVTGATTSDSLTNPISYFYFASADTATTSGVKGGGQNCSAGPVTLEGI